MAQAGTTITSSELGQSITFIRTASDTSGELLEMEAFYMPDLDFDRAVEHFHPRQDEQFDVLEGILSVRINGDERTYVAGESFQVPRGAVHIMANRSSKPTRVRWQVRPALNTEAFMETVWGLSAGGKLRPGTLQYLLNFVVILQEYGDVFAPSKPPRWLQRILIALLAPVGRGLGYRPRSE